MACPRNGGRPSIIVAERLVSDHHVIKGFTYVKFDPMCYHLRIKKRTVFREGAQARKDRPSVDYQTDYQTNFRAG